MSGSGMLTTTTGEFFDRTPRLSCRKEFKFWNIHRSKAVVIVFINNDEPAIFQDG